MFGKNYQKVLLKKVECLANIYKSDSLSYKLPRRKRYIQRDLFVLITSLNASYGHNIFTENLTIKFIWQVVNGRKKNNVTNRSRWEPITTYSVNFIMKLL